MLFSAPMVRALLAGNKTQTRRTVSHHNSLLDGLGVGKTLMADWLRLRWKDAWIDDGPSPAGDSGPYWRVWLPARDKYEDKTLRRIYPRIQVGDEIWVKETFCKTPDFGYAYRASTDADGERCRNELGLKWKSPIHMPREAARFVCEVVRVRTERLNDIGAEDALAEGIDHYVPGVTAAQRGEAEGNPVKEYRQLWDSINGANSWLINPPVWIYDLKRK